MKTIAMIGLGLLWAFPAAGGWPCPQQADVDGDGKPDRVVLSLERAEIETARGVIRLPLAPPAVRTVCLGDLDGDGRAEMVAGVVRAASKDRRLRMRLFVFDEQIGSARPKFFGTEGGGRLIDFGLQKLTDSEDRVHVLARESDRGEEVSRAYRWVQYGLEEDQKVETKVPEWLAEPRAVPAALSLDVDFPLTSLLDERALSFVRTPGRIRRVRLKAGMAPAVNRNKYRWLSKAARRHLVRHGFVVIRPREPASEIHTLYIDNQYRKLPSFVSADAALHLTHLLLDHAIQVTESELLAPALIRLLDGLYDRANDVRAAGAPALDGPLERILLRLAVARALLDGDLERVNPSRRAVVRRAVEQIEAAAGGQANPFGLDYSDYVVRGHYTRDELLGRYFRASLFLMQANTKIPAEAALLTGLVLADEDSVKLATLFQGFTRALVGPTTTRTPLDLADDVRAAFGETVSWQDLPGKPDWVGDLDKTPVTLLARAWPRGNDLLLAGVDVNQRPWPDPLDLMAALGSKRARELLAPDMERWADLGSRLDEAHAQVRSGAVLDTATVGGRWLASLRWLLLDYPEGYASFQRSKAWPGHNLVSAAASWTELRRDTILYVRPPVVWAEGGDEDNLPPSRAGFVEPVPELFAELAEVLAGLRSVLARYGGREVVGSYRQMRKPGPAGMLEDGEKLLRFLEACARKQLAGRGLKREEHEQLSGIGTRFEEILAGEGGLRPDPVPVIADVYYFGDPETGIKRPLLAATGPLDEIVVAVPLGKRVVLARGAALSFWHFRGEQPMSDPEWRELLESGKAPAQPDWAKPIEVKGKRRKRPRD